jgi:hypothetical protein
MLAFTMQLTIIKLINLSDTLTSNVLQNPVAEEEEEEHGSENASFEFINVQYSYHFTVFEKIIDRIRNNDFIEYRFNLINTFNPPPEYSI